MAVSQNLKNRIKLEVNIRKISGSFTNIWKLNKILGNNPRVNKEIKSKMLTYFELK